MRRSLKGKTGKIRTAEFRGAKYMVVPVVALVEGVVRPVNSEGPELVLASEFAHHPENWNGRPVMMNHPQVDGRYVSANAPEILEASGIGHAFGSTVTDRALHTEAWIERDRALALGGDAKRTVERLDAGEEIEVSVGVQLDIEAKRGTHEGQDYEAVWRNVGPDHIAFLKEGDTGACSIQMGCGAQRAAQQSQGPLRKLLTRVASALQLDAIERAEYEALLTGARSLGLFRSAITDVDLRGALEIVLRDAEPGFIGILAVDDAKTVLYHAFADGGGGVRTYARSFKKRDSKVTLNEDKQEVRAETTFISVNSGTPLRAACGCGRQPAASTATSGGTMKTKAEMIAALIASSKNGFTADDTTVLEAMTDARVKSLYDHDAALTVATAGRPSARKTELVGTLKAAQSVYSEAELQAMDEPALEKLAKLTTAQSAPGGVTAQMTEADVRRLFPSMAAAADAHSAAQATKKTQLVSRLKAAQKVHTEEQLNGMTVERLQEIEALVGAAAPVSDFSGLGLPSELRDAQGAADLPDTWGLKPTQGAAAH